MRLITNQGEFILPADFETTLSRSNIVLTDYSEQTSPITLPFVPHNLKLIGYSDRIDNYFKPISDIDIIIKSGLMVRRGNLGIHSANEDDGISCTIYLSSADFYSRIEEVYLPDLNWQVIKSPDYDNITLAQRVGYLIELMRAVYKREETTDEFRVAPLVTDSQITENGTSKDMVINDYRSPVIELGADYSAETFWGDLEHDITEDGSVNHVTQGYGMSPFLKLDYVLKFIFSCYDYSLDLSELYILFAQQEYEPDEETGEPVPVPMGTPKFGRICVANNVVDAIYAGVLKYAQLVPKVLIKDFLNKVCERYAGRFVMNDVTRQARFILYRNYFSTPADLDLTKYLASKPKLQATEFKTIFINTGSSTDSTGDESIDIELCETESIVRRFNIFQTTPEQNYDVPVTMAKVSGVVNLNNTLIVDGETVDQDKKLSSDIVFIHIPEQSKYSTSAGKKIYFRQSYPDLEYEEMIYLYKEYKEFRKNSNIPVACSLTIPELVLQQIDIHTPKILSGQLVLIESLSYSVNATNKKTVDAIFRTCRPYSDR